MQRLRRKTIRSRRRWVGRWSANAFVCLLALLLSASPAFAGVQDNVYSVGIGTRNIYQVNANGTVTSIFTTYSATASAAVAVRPSDGMLLFVTNVANGQVYSWNPSTPATAPVLLGTTGAAIPYIPRLAF